MTIFGNSYVLRLTPGLPEDTRAHQLEPEDTRPKLGDQVDSSKSDDVELAREAPRSTSNWQDARHKGRKQEKEPQARRVRSWARPKRTREAVDAQHAQVQEFTRT